MKTAILAVTASLLCLACATTSQRAPIADLHYTIDNDVLRFEHDGAMYVVTDPVIVDQASSAAKDLYFSMMGVVRGSGGAPSVRDHDYSYSGASTSIAGIAPVEVPTASTRESTQAYNNLMGNSLGFADYEAQAHVQRLSFQRSAAHAAKRLQEIFDRSVSGGLAQRVD